MKNIFALLFIAFLFDSCVNEKMEEKKLETLQPRIQIIETGGIILPNNRDEL